MFADLVKTPAAQSLARRLEAGGAQSFAGIARSAQPFFAALVQNNFPLWPVVVVTENLKAQEGFQQDLETWLNELRNAESGVGNQTAAPTPMFQPPASPLF